MDVEAFEATRNAGHPPATLGSPIQHGDRCVRVRMGGKNHIMVRSPYVRWVRIIAMALQPAWHTEFRDAFLCGIPADQEPSYSRTFIMCSDRKTFLRTAL